MHTTGDRVCVYVFFEWVYMCVYTKAERWQPGEGGHGSPGCVLLAFIYLLCWIYHSCATTFISFIFLFAFHRPFPIFNCSFFPISIRRSMYCLYPNPSRISILAYLSSAVLLSASVLCPLCSPSLSVSLLIAVHLCILAFRASNWAGVTWILGKAGTAENRIIVFCVLHSEGGQGCSLSPYVCLCERENSTEREMENIEDKFNLRVQFYGDGCMFMCVLRVHIHSKLAVL